jgi:GntR family transcriptional regulator/MocR family aminotransferase
VRAETARLSFLTGPAIVDLCVRTVSVLRPWELVFNFERVAHVALHLQIAETIVDEIRRGRLIRGTAMPGTRVLADELGVNRKTVALAYDELKAQGWISSQARRGTFVSIDMPSLAAPQEAVTSGGTRFRIALDTAVVQRGDACASAQTAEFGWPAARELTEGEPDTRLIPFAALSRAFHRTIVTMTRSNQLGYADARGALVLRTAIAAMLRMERSLDVGADNVCIVRGSQMGIFLAARLLIRPGDCVVFESLSYPPARAAFASCGAQVLNVAHDEQGPMLDALEALCHSHRVRAVFVMPHHQFPTTATMSVARRAGLLALAARFDFSIVEDDYDHEFHFEADAPLPLASLDAAGRVLYIGSLSKVLAPGLRLGYLVASHEIVERCAGEVMLIDRQGNALTELAVADMMGRGELGRHIRRARRVYQNRRDHAVAIMRAHFGSDIDFSIPAGGLALWIRLHPRIDVDGFEYNARQQGVRLLAGRLFTDDTSAVQAFRLGYGGLNETELEKIVAALRLACPT